MNANDENNNIKLYFFFFINLDNILWLRQTDREGERDRGIFIRRDPIEVSSICL